jgi:hypothetical protein
LWWYQKGMGSSKFAWSLGNWMLLQKKILVLYFLSLLQIMVF